jgi:Tol biopolymer transport system component
MRRKHAFYLASLLLGLALLSGAEGARAEPGPIELISKSTLEQAESAEAPAISADGRYVAFEGKIGGRWGIFRKDLATGAIVAVSAGSAYENKDPVVSAERPSISADGRYVSFTTKAPLDPVDDGAESVDKDVYVADMSTTPPTYELASARDGCDPGISATPCGLSYAEGEGSVAAGRVALSADGRKVAFVITSKSDLMDQPGQIETPAGQVVVRNLETDRTTLVSVERDPVTGTMTGLPVEGGAVVAGFGNGAALSADGSTVAWLGGNLPRQVSLLSDEAMQIAIDDGGGVTPYDEPLWRRIANGPTAPTRRIIGGSDPLAAGCPAAGTLSDPDCQGPFPNLANLTNAEQGCSSNAGWLILGGPAINGVPALSADGRTVALIGQPEGFADVFVVDMAEGLSRRQGLRRLTGAVPIQRPCEAVNPESKNGSGPITAVAISPAGNRIAFSTSRQQFPLSPPHLATPAPSKQGIEELYLLDLHGETIERLTPANRAEASTSEKGGETGASSLSLDENGEKLAFASDASNLVAGDANGKSDVFVVTDPIPSTSLGQTSISAPPGRPQPNRLWRLSASAVSLRDGGVKVRAVVPGAGRLRVKAQALVGARLRRRQVAAAGGRAKQEGLLRLEITLKPGYRGLAKARPGLPAILQLSFRGPGGKPLHASLNVRFVAKPKKSGSKAGGRR